jgi:RNA polymerase sigma-70 factor (ECF subfamily)
MSVANALDTRQPANRLHRDCGRLAQPDIWLRSINDVQAALKMNPGAGSPVPSAAMERDADLLAALRAGDRHAVLEGLMDRYRQKVMHLAVSILRDQALAEDMSQTVFVKVWQALPKFDGRASLSTWLYTIARNTCLTAVERERRIVPLEDFAEVADDDGDPLLFGTAQAGHETAGQAAAEYDVAKLLDQLPEPYRRVVVLFYLEDRSCEEVGELLSMPTGTVKALLHRGRKRLAALAGGATETES